MYVLVAVPLPKVTVICAFTAGASPNTASTRSNNERCHHVRNEVPYCGGRDGIIGGGVWVRDRFMGGLLCWALLCRVSAGTRAGVPEAGKEETEKERGRVGAFILGSGSIPKSAANQKDPKNKSKGKIFSNNRQPITHLTVSARYKTSFPDFLPPTIPRDGLFATASGRGMGAPSDVHPYLMERS